MSGVVTEIKPSTVAAGAALESSLPQTPLPPVPSIFRPTGDGPSLASRMVEVYNVLSQRFSVITAAAGFQRSTPLHAAAREGDLKAVQRLVAEGADQTLLDENGDTALDVALRYEKNNIVRFLIDPDTKASLDGKITGDPEDIEGTYYLHFEKSYEGRETLEQLLALEKLADLALQKREFTKAAHLLNNALAGAILYQLSAAHQHYLLSKLERIEQLFLAEMGIRTPRDHQGYLAKYRHRLSAIREEAESELLQGCKIEYVQAGLTQRFKTFLKELIESSILLLSERPPTAFAVLGLGSMARDEMCPNSDVEFAILIEEDTPGNREYFYRLTRLLELRIINLGETFFPLIRPKRVEEVMMDGRSFTPKGFSMDSGGLSPLGKAGVYDLIGTPKKLAMFQESWWVKKSGAEEILSSALISNCRVMGEERLIEEYSEAVRRTLNVEIRQERARALLRGHLEEFSPRLDEHRAKLRAFDIKQDLYRPLQMIIGALALYFGLESAGTLVQIEELRRKGVLSSAGALNLQRALLSVLIWRIGAHLRNGSEKELLSRTWSDDPLAEDLIVLKENEARTLIEIYRVLVPLSKNAFRFLKGDKRVISRGPFYDPLVAQLGAVEDRIRPSCQETEIAYAQYVALNPDNMEARFDLIRIELALMEDALKEFGRLIKGLNLKQFTLTPDLGRARDRLKDISVTADEQKECFFKLLEFYERVIGKEYPKVGRSCNQARLRNDAVDIHIKAAEDYQVTLGMRIDLINREIEGGLNLPSLENVDWSEFDKLFEDILTPKLGEEDSTIAVMK